MLLLLLVACIGTIQKKFLFEEQHCSVPFYIPDAHWGFLGRPPKPTTQWGNTRFSSLFPEIQSKMSMTSDFVFRGNRIQTIKLTNLRKHADGKDNHILNLTTQDYGKRIPHKDIKWHKLKKLCIDSKNVTKYAFVNKPKTNPLSNWKFSNVILQHFI